MKDLTEYLAIAERNLIQIRERRPRQISISELGVWSKGPYKALVIRGGLLWRSEELARTGIRALADGDRATGISLSRSVIENSALHWRLWSVLANRSKKSADLDETLTKMLLGWRGDDEFPEAFNVLTMIDHLDREIEGVRRTYNRLSEVAHPNYGGVHGLFAQVDEPNFTTHFGAELRGSEIATAAAASLGASLGIQIVADDRFSTELVAWISELPSLDGPRPPD